MQAWLFQLAQDTWSCLGSLQWLAMSLSRNFKVATPLCTGSALSSTTNMHPRSCCLMNLQVDLMSSRRTLITGSLSLKVCQLCKPWVLPSSVYAYVHWHICGLYHTDTSKSRIVGTASLVVERKFLRHLGKVCVHHVIHNSSEVQLQVTDTNASNLSPSCSVDI